MPSAPAGAPDRSVFTGAVARYRALERLRAFRESLYECLDARADALFELADAVLCAGHAVTSLVRLCLEPEFTRGHGALYDALSAGRVDDEKLFSLLAAELPQAVAGPEARAWIAEHDVIDRGLLEEALAGLPPEDAAQVRDVLRRLRATGHGRRAAPLFVFDAGYSAAALADGLAGCPVHVLVRVAAGSVFYAEPVTWEGRYGRPARRGAAVHCLEPADFAAAAAGNGPRGRKQPLPPNPEPDETLALPDTPLYGTVRAQAWHGVHPLIHGDRGWFAGRRHLPMAPSRRPPPPLGEAARPLPATGAGPGPPRVSQHPPRAGHTRPCRETLPPWPRQAQRQQQRTSSPLPSPRRGRHAAHSKTRPDQGKG